jgi:alkylation response protein AidB-like acyl-CoA dehydrogenase
MREGKNMDLGLDTEQQILKDVARDFFENECPKSLVREVRESDDDYPKELWENMAELGWMGVVVPEEYGGIGGDFMDLAILLETMGEACLPAPFFSTVVIGGYAVQLSAAEELKAELLPRIASGELILAFALIEPGNSHGVVNIGTAAVADGDSYVLNGTKLFVEYARSSDYLLTVARVPDEGLAFILVETGSTGVEINPVKTLDDARHCGVVLTDVRVPVGNLLALGEEAEKLMTILEQRASVAKCAEMLGGMQAAFEMSVAYAKEREQFNRPIGSFQAVQHHCANMIIDLDSSRYITNLAAWRISRGLPASKEASMAKSYTSAASNRVLKLGHQIHGAISYCDEHDMHLWLRRNKAASVAFGDAEYHLEKVAQQLGL